MMMRFLSKVLTDKIISFFLIGICVFSMPLNSAITTTTTNYSYLAMSAEIAERIDEKNNGQLEYRLSENGVDVILDLPQNCIVDERTRPYWLMASFEGMQVVLEITDGTPEKQANFVRRVYEGLLESYPDTTYFEELPDIVTDMGVFTVRKIIYENVNGKMATSLQAFCRVNYRYIYSITLRMDAEIDYDALKYFTTAMIVKTSFQWPLEMLLLTYCCAFVGLFIILFNYGKKHFRLRTSGTIIGVRGHSKSNTVLISYLSEDGTEIVGEHNMIAPGAIPYMRKNGKKVEISYSIKRPSDVNIISSKAGYIVGGLFLIMAIFGLYLMIFQL